MPALFQYAIFFLAALLCISLVLCVRDTTDPANKDATDPARKDAPAAPPAGDKAAGPALPAAAPLQRVAARVKPDGVRPGGPAFPRTISPPAVDAASPKPLERTLSPGPADLAPLRRNVLPLVSDRSGPDTNAALPPRAVQPAAGDPVTRPTPSHGFGTDPAPAATGLPSGDPAGSPARPVPDAASREAAPETVVRGLVPLGSAALRPAASETPAPTGQRTGLRPEAGETSRSGDLPAGPVAGRPGEVVGEHLVTRARLERELALDQRNDTLWDLVVHLRDYVEQLRAERHTLREEARQLRIALSEATEEVRVLRTAQAAANCNEQAKEPAEARPGEPVRLGAAPNRLH